MITPAQCRAARALLNWPRKYLAAQACISTKTLLDFENETRTPLRNNLLAIEAALQKGGVEFLEGGCICVKQTNPGAVPTE